MKIAAMPFLFLFLYIIPISAQNVQATITVSNPLNFNRSNEMIEIAWDDIARVILALQPADICLRDKKTLNELINQVIYKDQTSVPEKIIWMSDFKANETKQFVVEKLNRRNLKPVPPMTDVRFMPPREDIAWENDRMAFRIYGPAYAHELNNGLDVWVKRVRYLIIEKWYKLDEADSASRISYHEDHGEGADLFNVWQSLGAGSCALYQGDSLYQPGVFKTYKILATGPLRASFEVTYKPVLWNGSSISETKRITLDAGSNLNKVQVTYNCSSLKGTVPFAAGLVKRPNITVAYDEKSGWLSFWGAVNEKEINGFLGTGLIIPKKFFNGQREDGIHCYLLGTAELGVPSIYYAGAGWTRSGDFKDGDEWNKYLMEFSQRLEFPCIISVTARKE